MRLFESHNLYSKLTYLIVGFSSVVGVLYLVLFFSSLENSQGMLPWIIGGVLGLMLCLNTLFAYRIFKKSRFALIGVALLYLLQIVSIESPQWAFSVSFGMQVTLSWQVDEVTVGINFLALMISALALVAVRSVEVKKKHPS